MRFLAILATVAFLAASPALAAFNGPVAGQSGGFNGPVMGSDSINVAKAKNLADDSRVVLTGHIVSRVGNTKKLYIFKDPSGEINAKIGQKAFGNLNISPADTVRIFGKIDKDFGKPVKVEVKRIEIVQPGYAQ